MMIDVDNAFHRSAELKQRDERLAVENAMARDELKKLKGMSVEGDIHLEKEIPLEPKLAGIVGKSPALLDVLRQIEAVAPTNSGVLVQGETGTGKELIARAN